MSKYLRTFYCKDCHVPGELVPVEKGVSAVTCPGCETHEYWGSAVRPIDEPMNDFDFWDLRFADC